MTTLRIPFLPLLMGNVGRSAHLGILSYKTLEQKIVEFSICLEIVSSDEYASDDVTFRVHPKAFDGKDVMFHCEHRSAYNISYGPPMLPVIARLDSAEMDSRLRSYGQVEATTRGLLASHFALAKDRSATWANGATLPKGLEQLMRAHVVLTLTMTGTERCSEVRFEASAAPSQWSADGKVLGEEIRSRMAQAMQRCSVAKANTPPAADVMRVRLEGVSGQPMYDVAVGVASLYLPGVYIHLEARKAAAEDGWALSPDLYTVSIPASSVQQFESFMFVTLLAPAEPWLVGTLLPRCSPAVQSTCGLLGFVKLALHCWSFSQVVALARLLLGGQVYKLDSDPRLEQLQVAAQLHAHLSQYQSADDAAVWKDMEADMLLVIKTRGREAMTACAGGRCTTPYSTEVLELIRHYDAHIQAFCAVTKRMSQLTDYEDEDEDEDEEGKKAFVAEVLGCYPAKDQKKKKRPLAAGAYSNVAKAQKLQEGMLAGWAHVRGWNAASQKR